MTSSDLDRSSETVTPTDISNIQTLLWEPLTQYKQLHPDFESGRYYQQLGEQLVTYVNQYKPQILFGRVIDSGISLG